MQQDRDCDNAKLFNSGVENVDLFITHAKEWKRFKIFFSQIFFLKYFLRCIVDCGLNRKTLASSKTERR